MKEQHINTDLLEVIYSKLITTESSSLLSDLADIICGLFDDSEKENVLYFSMPIWDYMKNCWKKPTVSRVNSKNEKNGTVKIVDNDCWISELSDVAFKQTTYYKFFKEAGKQFSFIEFFTQHVKTISPLFTIEFLDVEHTTYDGDSFCLSCPQTIGSEELIDDFIEQTKELLPGDKFEENINKLKDFYVFLSKYQQYFANDIRYIYLISSRLHKQDNDVYIGSGGVIIVCKGLIEDETLKLISVLTNLCYRELGGKNWAERSKKEAIKSAIAAIMSRNLSHNLGSHYLYYTKKDLTELADSMDEKGPDIRGAAQVLGYVQARMDYLATIVAGEKYPYGSVYFKGQIFDELTIDDFSARHYKGFQAGKNRVFQRTTNYLLRNLILSENFTRPSVLTLDDEVIGCQNELGVTLTDKEKKDDDKLIKLRVLYNGDEFTGSPCSEVEKNEEVTKLLLSKLCVALPGGIMSVHAFFNVVENMIRNSAKYLKEDFKHDGLLVTIDIRENEEKIWNNDVIPSYTFTVFDNKGNALGEIKKETASGEQEKSQTLIELMNDKLRSLSILTTENELEKSDKGLKEMLFSTLWMRSYTYEKSKKMSDVLLEIESKNGDEKLREINDHAFGYVAVDDDGNEGTSESPLEEGNLGIRFVLPQYRMMKVVDLSSLSNAKMKSMALNSFTDIICIQNELKGEKKEKIHKWFTRIFYDKGKLITKETENDTEKAVEALKQVLRERFRDFDKYKLVIGSRAEKSGVDDLKKYGICYVGHIEHKDKASYKKILDNAYYCESISGGNFTKTIENLFLNGTTDDGVYLNYEVEYFGLKVKEAALTRITLIDERFCKNMNRSTIECELVGYKNVRILNLNPKESIDLTKGVLGLFDGNSFCDNSENKDFTHFLSIHLGMIEKIVDDEDYSRALELDKPTKVEREDVVDIKGKRAIALMAKLKEMFKAEFITVHSGRGNFSKDLEGPLKEYQFISVSALESVLTNSKFLLSQLFYNTVYIGKGIANE